MDFQDYELCGEYGDSYWWFAGKNKIVLDFARKIARFFSHDPRILDIGCGRGEMLESLGKLGKVVAVDNSDNLQAWTNPPNCRLIQCDGNVLCFKDNLFDLVIMLDILEHFEDDFGALMEAYARLKPGGCLLMTVPAVPSLYGNHDILLKHFRRYSQKSVLELVQRTGFKVERITHWNFFLFLPIYLIRMLKKTLNSKSSDIFPMPEFVNRILTGLLHLESVLIGMGANFPFGINLLLVLRK